MNTPVNPLPRCFKDWHFVTLHKTWICRMTYYPIRPLAKHKLEFQLSKLSFSTSTDSALGPLVLSLSTSKLCLCKVCTLLVFHYIHWRVSRRYSNLMFLENVFTRLSALCSPELSLTSDLFSAFYFPLPSDVRKQNALGDRHGFSSVSASFPWWSLDSWLLKATCRLANNY